MNSASLLTYPDVLERNSLVTSQNLCMDVHAYLNDHVLAPLQGQSGSLSEIRFQNQER